ncbi:helix-turn-helix domain-containing protein [Pseudovibrio sp. Tun.PSC04-5.I4]|uniref:helix-turn-helix domain-containing protein n=1 Tax=Pseudovibrio sp. Tun.PSC04-5.I4 TaxID=1798213 RepID=UPI0008808149|nr:helix-turn-helix domain-containing protein [Pseudovibrio sp. Tun.PSC04-5.I4]SDQ37711.1 putative transcriptional regulator [Pseudovibrio sp. Tun.PSC04-5.I4]SDR45396.1 putative transcriptional regulator [Pseudovibrio sp. Tun.PSC04-5.I4]
MSAFSSVSQGLNEALAYAEGKDINATLHQVEVPAVDVCGIRKSTGLSQSDFAKSIGVAKGTLVNWEQGRRHPSGPAQILLALIARKPTVVQDLLTDK